MLCISIAARPSHLLWGVKLEDEGWNEVLLLCITGDQGASFSVLSPTGTVLINKRNLIWLLSLGKVNRSILNLNAQLHTVHWEGVNHSKTHSKGTRWYVWFHFRYILRSMLWWEFSGGKSSQRGAAALHHRRAPWPQLQPTGAPRLRPYERAGLKHNISLVTWHSGCCLVPSCALCPRLWAEVALQVTAGHFFYWLPRQAHIRSIPPALTFPDSLVLSSAKPVQ